MSDGPSSSKDQKCAKPKLRIENTPPENSLSENIPSENAEYPDFSFEFSFAERKEESNRQAFQQDFSEDFLTFADEQNLLNPEEKNDEDDLLTFADEQNLLNPKEKNDEDDLLIFADEQNLPNPEEENDEDELLNFADEPANRETEAFFQALRNQDLPRIQELLSNGENVDRSDSLGWTPLQIAAGTGSLEIVKLLANRGAAMDAGNLPLFFAADSGSLDLVRFLLEKFSISPLILDPDGNSLLHHAAESRSPELVRFLLDVGVPVNLQGNARLTALERAARNGDLQTVQALVEAGAEINSEGGRWSAPLSEIRNPFYHDIFLYGPPLYAAAAIGSLEIVQYLVEHGADINAKDCDGRTVLHAAARAKNPSVMQFLLKLGAE